MTERVMSFDDDDWDDLTSRMDGKPKPVVVRLPDDVVEKVSAWATDLVARYKNDGDRITAMPWTRRQLTDNELRQWRASRKEAGRRIDPETCEIGCWYADGGEPYDIRDILGEDLHLERYYDKFNFVRSPDSNGWVCECDLPMEKWKALDDRISREYPR
jgi:hypothetical protein